MTKRARIAALKIAQILEEHSPDEIRDALSLLGSDSVELRSFFLQDAVPREDRKRTTRRSPDVQAVVARLGISDPHHLEALHKLGAELSKRPASKVRDIGRAVDKSFAPEGRVNGIIRILHAASKDDAALRTALRMLAPGSGDTDSFQRLADRLIRAT